MNIFIRFCRHIEDLRDHFERSTSILVEQAPFEFASALKTFVQFAANFWPRSV